MIVGLRRQLRSTDVRVAVGFMVAAVVEAIVRSRDPAYLAINLSGAPLLLVLALRRARPAVTVAALCAGAVVGTLLDAWLIPHLSSDVFVPIFGILLAMYSVGAHGSRRDVAVAAPLPIVVVLLTDLFLPSSSDPVVQGMIFFAIFIVAVPILGGRLVRSRSLQVRQLEAQGRELAEQRSAFVSAALTRERLRVAGQLDRDLAEGMLTLVDALPGRDVVIDATQVESLESQARQLLSATRSAVVALADDAPSAPGLSEDEHEVGTGSPDEAQPWIVLAAAALVAGLLFETRDVHAYVPRWTVVGAIVLLGLALAFAWAQPLLAIAALWAGSVGFTHLVAPLDHTFSVIGLSFVPPFIVAALEPRRRALVGLLVCWCGAVLLFGVDAIPGDLVIAGACWLAGAGFRERTRLVEQIRDNNMRIEAGRASLTAHAVAEERMRMARELHDAVGHALTVVAIQAGAARRIWDADRARADAMLETVRSVATAGLTELRTGLSVSTDREVDALGDLVLGATQAGLAVDATIGDVVDDLSAPQLATVYRVLQEALTNVLKHSPGAHVAIDIHSAGGQLEVSIVNSRGASAPAPRAPSSGHGLTGMEERVHDCGGALMCGPDEHGGFAVHAQLPLTMMSA